MDQIVKTGVQIEYIYIYIWENIDKRMSLGLLMLLLFWMLRIEKCLLAGLFTLHYYVWLPCCAVRLCTFVHVCMYVCMDVCMYVCMYATEQKRDAKRAFVEAQRPQEPPYSNNTPFFSLSISFLLLLPPPSGGSTLPEQLTLQGSDWRPLPQLFQWELLPLLCSERP